MTGHQAGEDADDRELLPRHLVAHGAILVQIVVIGTARGFAAEGQRRVGRGLGADRRGQQVLDGLGIDVLGRVTQGSDARGRGKCSAGGRRGMSRSGNTARLAAIRPALFSPFSLPRNGPKLAVRTLKIPHALND